MSPRPTVIGRRAGATVLAALALASGCEPLTESGEGTLAASLAVAPVLAPGVAAFTGSLIDNARIRVIRPALTDGTQPTAEIVVDTTVPFPAESTQISLRLIVPLRARSERMLVRVDLQAALVPLLAGSETVEVYAIGAGPASLPRPVLVYVGPGDAATLLVVEPQDTVLTFGTSFTFRAKAFDQSGASVDDFIVQWSSTHPDVPISPTGGLTAPLGRGEMYVKAETPTSLIDSVLVRFAPVPVEVAAFAGGGQAALAGTSLPIPLSVRVTAADGLGVPGVVVRFRALDGGSVTTPLAVTNAEGIASTTAQLGPLAGAQNFDATVEGFTPALFAAIAL